MRLLLLISFIALGMSANAQKCKYDYDKEDKMTGKPVRRIDFKINAYHYLSFYRNGDKYQLTQTATQGGEINENIEKGADLKIKLNNGEILEFKSTNTASPQSYVFNGQVYSRFVVEFEVDPEVFKKIEEHGFAIFSFDNHNGIANSFELKKKHAAKTIDGARCILQD